MSETTNYQGIPTLGNGARWAENLDFKKPVIYGFAFIALVVLSLMPWMHFELKAQRLSFASAVKTLAGKELKEPLTQFGSVLQKRDGIYRWSAVIWERAPGDEKATFVPKIFSASVDRADDYRVTDLTVIPYEEKTAWKFGIYN